MISNILYEKYDNLNYCSKGVGNDHCTQINNFF